MLVELHDHYSTRCDVCDAPKALRAPSFALARIELLEAGWQERHRKGGAKKSAWACPTCAEPASKSMGPSTGTHGDITKTK